VRIVARNSTCNAHVLRVATHHQHPTCVCHGLYSHPPLCSPACPPDAPAPDAAPCRGAQQSWQCPRGPTIRRPSQARSLALTLTITLTITHLVVQVLQAHRVLHHTQHVVRREHPLLEDDAVRLGRRVRWIWQGPSASGNTAVCVCVCARTLVVGGLQLARHQVRVRAAVQLDVCVARPLSRTHTHTHTHRSTPYRHPTRATT
jgi:hypothetical protein